jgi:hypothetical protein
VGDFPIPETAEAQISSEKYDKTIMITINYIYPISYLKIMQVI